MRTRNKAAIPRRAHCFWIHNTTAEEIAAQSLAEITGQYVNGIFDVQKMQCAGITRLAVVPRAIAADGVGRGYQAGNLRVNVTLIAGETLVAGNRITPHTDSWNARRFCLGPLLVEHVEDLIVGTSATAICRLDRRRPGE